MTAELLTEERLNFTAAYAPPSERNIFETWEEILPWNQLVKAELIARQKKTKEGCVFVWMWAMLVKDPIRLPPAQVLWESIRTNYGDVLERGSLRVSPDKLATTIKYIYPLWGIELTNYSLSEKGKHFGESLQIFGEPKITTPNYYFDLFQEHPLPYGLLLKQSGGNYAHFISIDDYETGRELKIQNQKDGYRPIAIFEFNRCAPVGLNGNFGITRGRA